MAIPSRDEIKTALLSFIRENGGVDGALTPDKVYEGLAIKFSLSPADLSQKRGTESHWKNEVRWARQVLVDEGQLERKEISGKGIWKLAHLSIPSEIRESESTYKLKNNVHTLDLIDDFSVDEISNTRELTLQSIKLRRGQNTFRSSLIRAYQSRCCITNESCIEVLEAAHIIPYSGKSSNHIQNGILLRSDIHTLFDLQLIQIDPATFKIHIANSISSPAYRQFHGSRIFLPHEQSHWPSTDALRQRLNGAI